MATEIQITLTQHHEPEDFRTEECQHGIVIRTKNGGSLPISSITEHASKWPTGQVCISVAHILRCIEHGAEYQVHTVIAKDDAAAEAWRAEVSAMIPETLTPVQRFLWSEDYGLSAGFLVFMFTNETPPGMPHPKAAYPYDCDSFRRCCVALNSTGLRPRLKELADYGPYRELVALWSVLEKAMADEHYEYADGVLKALARLRDPKRATMFFECGSVSMPMPALERLIEETTGAPVADLPALLSEVSKQMGATFEFSSD